MHKKYQKHISSGQSPVKCVLGGFTLIELLVVVLIIGVLTAVAVPQYRKAAAKARTVRILPLLRGLAEAEERFYIANGYYTAQIQELDVGWPDKYLPDGQGVEWNISPSRISAGYTYRVDMPVVGYYFAYGAASEEDGAPAHKPGKFYCNGYDSEIKKWVCQSLGTPVYAWTPHFTYW